MNRTSPKCAEGWATFARVAAATAALALLVTSISATSAAAPGQLLEPVLKAAEEHYLRPVGLTLADAERDWPSQVALVVGLVLRGQAGFALQDPVARRNWDAVQSETTSYFEALAHATAYVERFGGRTVNGPILWDICVQAMHGSHDEYARREFGRGPYVERNLLVPDSPPREQLPTSERLFVQRDEQVNLLGQRPHMPPERHPETDPDQYFLQTVIPVYNAYVDAWNASVRAYVGGSLNASRQSYQRAYSLCQQVFNMAPNLVRCNLGFVEQRPSNQPQLPYSELGPYDAGDPYRPPQHDYGPSDSRELKRHWNQ